MQSEGVLIFLRKVPSPNRPQMMFFIILLTVQLETLKILIEAGKLT